MTYSQKTITVALADDHLLLCNALATLLNTFPNVEVLFTATNGTEVIEMINQREIPDILIMDLNMPGTDGYETARWLQKNEASVKVLILTMYDSDITLIRLLQAGVKGFLKKDIHPDELKIAIHNTMQYGYYYQQSVSGKLASLVVQNEDNEVMKRKALTEQELLFLKLSCTEMTYKEVATQMNLTPRAVDTLRDNLFIKLDLKSRVGLAIYAIRTGLVQF